MNFKGMKTFLTIWIGQMISILGSSMTSFALGVWIYQQTGEATPFAITVLFGTLPRVLLAPIAGSVADRFNRRWIMILSDCGDALVSLCVVFLLLGGHMQVWHIYLIALVSSVFTSFQEPAYIASTTMLVPKEQFTRASGMMQFSEAITSLLAPTLAGLLLGVIGMQGIIAIDFVTFFFAIGSLLIVRIPQPEKTSVTSEDGKQNMWSDIRFGFRYLTERPGLLSLLFYFALVNFLMNLSAVLLTPMILSFSNAATLGVVQTVYSLGMLLGSVLISAWGGPKKNRVPALIAFIGLGAVGLAITGLRPSMVFPMIGMFLLMFSLPFGSSISRGVFQSKVAPDVQGRVFATRSMISQSMMPIAFIIAGPLADQIFNPLMLEGGALANTFFGTIFGVGIGRGVGVIFTLAGLILVLASLGIFANPRVRNIETELPDVIADAQEEPATAATPAVESAA